MSNLDRDIDQALMMLRIATILTIINVVVVIGLLVWLVLR